MDCAASAAPSRAFDLRPSGAEKTVDSLHGNEKRSHCLSRSTTVQITSRSSVVRPAAFCLPSGVVSQ